MHDAAGARSFGRASLWRILVDNACGAVVKPASDRHNAISILNREVGIGGPVHAEHVHGERVALVEDAHAMDRGSHRNLRLLCYLSHQLMAIAATLANVQDRVLGLVDESASLPNRFHIKHRWSILVRLLRRRFEDSSWHLRLHRYNVLWQVDMARTWSTRHRNAEGLVNSPRQLIEVETDVIPFSARSRNFRCLALLKGICSHRTCRHLPRKNNHGHTVGICILQRRNQIRHTWATRHNTDAYLTSRLRICRGRMPTALFVDIAYELDLAVIKSI
mmetsp:Transcript_67506/g.106922  ORF Transcript_67506/g.106922 Transcript_67506/m.106922 type:complete len:276 (-) Transcript_67506:324-1151(-)